MPDNSSPDFRAAQQAHAGRLLVERELMERTGLTRNQVRANLRRFNERAKQAERNAQAAATISTLSSVKTTSVTFQPNVGGPTGTGAIGGQPALPQFQGIVAQDRYPFNATIFGFIGAEITT